MSAEDTPRTIEGTLAVPPGAKFAIVASRFNSFIVDRLADAAVDALVRHGAAAKNVTIVKVPGSWEIPVVCSQLLKAGGLDAIIAVGAVIRGSTGHYDQVAGEVSKGIAQVALATGTPIAFGILTTDTLEQAIERAGSKQGNKGWDAAVTAIEMVSLARALGSAKL